MKYDTCINKIKLLIIIIVACNLNLFASNNAFVDVVSINVDSVVIMRRSTYCPSTVTKFLVTNEALTITEFKKRNRGLTFDIDISSDLIDSFDYEMYKQITISNEYFNQIKYNLFNDLNALYILETDSVVVSCNYDKLGKYSFCFPLTSENMPKDWKTSQKLSVEVYKNGNIEIKSIDSNGNFSSDNSELVSKYSYYDNNYLDCRIKYSTYFVDLYRLIDHMISDLNNND